MTLDSNKSIVRRFIEEIWNKRQLYVADEVFASNCISHQLRSGGELTMPRGPQEIKHHIAEWLEAFPDIHFTVERVLAEADYVMTNCLARGTHLGKWHGIPATGKEIAIRMAVVHRIKEEKIVEDWVLVDFLGVFQQLGVVQSTVELLNKRTEETETL